MLPGQQAARLSLGEGHFHESQGSWQEVLSAHGLLEVLLVPLVGDEIMGSLFVARRHRLPFTNADEKLLARLALVISSAIRNAELQRRTERALTELRRSLESIARLRDIQEKLTELVLRGERLSSLTAAIAVLVDNPVLLEDRYGTVLSCAAPAGWVGSEPVTLAQLAQRNRDAARFIGELFQLDHHTRLLTVPGEDRSRLVAPVIVGNETLAILSVRQALRVLNDLDMLAVQGAALMISIDDFEHLVKLGEREEVLQRTKQNIYDLVRASLAPRTPRWLIWGSGTQVVALVAVNPDGLNPIFEAARRLHSRAERELPGASILVGVSQICHNMREVPSAYAEVKRFLKFGRAMQWQSGLIFVERLGLYRILLQYEELGPDLIQFASSRLSRLQTYDQEHGADLIACLRAYLTGGCEIKTTAETLRLHRNSVRYKLQRIEELAQVDLNDAETRFQLQLALKIIDLQSAIKLSALS
jgi:GAF domain-containing protein